MQADWPIQELAIFSLQHWSFGVDARDIVEILALKSPHFLSQPEASRPFVLLSHNAQCLPIFHLLQMYSRVPGELAWELESPFTCIIFRNAGQTLGCVVDKVVDFVPVPLQRLNPVPRLLTRIFPGDCVWGFYDLTADLIPLLELRHIFTPQIIRPALMLRDQLDTCCVKVDSP